MTWGCEMTMDQIIPPEIDLACNVPLDGPQAVPQTPQDIIRVLRVIEYVGRRSWVERTIAASIHGTRQVSSVDSIRAATIGTFPDILTPAAKAE